MKGLTNRNSISENGFLSTFFTRFLGEFPEDNATLHTKPAVDIRSIVPMSNVVILEGNSPIGSEEDSGADSYIEENEEGLTPATTSAEDSGSDSSTEQQIPSENEETGSINESVPDSTVADQAVPSPPSHTGDILPPDETEYNSHAINRGYVNDDSPIEKSDAEDIHGNDKVSEESASNPLPADLAPSQVCILPSIHKEDLQPAVQAFPTTNARDENDSHDTYTENDSGADDYPDMEECIPDTIRQAPRQSLRQRFNPTKYKF